MEERDIKYEKYPYSEDYHFLMQAAARAKIGMIKDVLVGYRIHQGQFTNREPKEDEYREDDEIIESYCDEMGIAKSECDIAKRANRKELHTKEDFELLKTAVYNHAARYNLDLNKVSDKKDISKVYTKCVLTQYDRNMSSLKTLCASKMVDKRQILSILGASYIIHCLLGGK